MTVSSGNGKGIARNREDTQRRSIDREAERRKGEELLSEAWRRSCTEAICQGVELRNSALHWSTKDIFQEDES